MNGLYRCSKLASVTAQNAKLRLRFAWKARFNKAGYMSGYLNRARMRISSGLDILTNRIFSIRMSCFIQMWKYLAAIHKAAQSLSVFTKDAECLSLKTTFHVHIWWYTIYNIGGFGFTYQYNYHTIKINLSNVIDLRLKQVKGKHTYTFQYRLN